jgi:hypothetical protein
MKMRLEVSVFLEGCCEALWAQFDDDVDAEGTMIAKYVAPIRSSSFDIMPYEFGEYLITRPQKVIAIYHHAFALDKEHIM